MAKHEKFSNEMTRKITETWTLENNYRVKVYTYHDKNKKVYWSIISECLVSESGTSGLYFERHSLHQDLNRLIQSIPATRYNYEKMSTWHVSAVAQVTQLVADLLASHENEQVSA